MRARSITSFDRHHVKYLGCLFADTSVAAGDDDDFPGQIRNVVSGELGLRSEVTLDNSRAECLEEDADGGGIARARHA